MSPLPLANYNDRPVALYRIYNADTELLYVGVSHSVLRRLDEHLTAKPWWPAVAWISVEHFADRFVAEAAESLAIREERPKYNVHAATPRRVVEYSDCLSLAIRSRQKCRSRK
jgi:hypothetical protein